MNVIKRNGQEVLFDASKIADAIRKASLSTERTDISETDIKNITNHVVLRCSALNRAVSVEEIQDMVEEELMKTRFHDIARNYITYRYKRALVRRSNTTDDRILSIIDRSNEEVIQENANKNPVINSVQRDYMAGEVSKDLVKRFFLPEDIYHAHEEGMIHFHDADYFAQRMHNCFSGSTRFITDRGVRSFDSFNDGDTVTVRDKDGVFRKAVVRSYGPRKMNWVHFRSGDISRTITCTPDHRWILEDSTVTTELAAGDRLYLVHAYGQIEPDDLQGPDLEAYAAGFALAFLEKGGADSCTARAEAYPKQVCAALERAGVAVVEKEGRLSFCFSRAGIEEALDKKIWKDMSAQQQAAMFTGLFHAAGVACTMSLTVRDERIAGFINETSELAGYYITYIQTSGPSIQKQMTYFFFTSQIDETIWTVDSIESCPHGAVDAWCVEEPVTHSFTLAGGIVTGNCDLVNLEDMLQNGTVISGTRIDRPHSFATACNIATQIIAQVASNQYGGQSITLAHLVPFIQTSRERYRKEVREELVSSGLAADDEIVEKIAEGRLQREVRAGVQTLQYQVITLMTTNGQAPFISVFMYLDEVPEGQARDDLAMLIREVLEQRITGVKNEKGVYITTAFPKLLYVLDEDNIYPDSPYYYLTELAAKCSAKRLVPDYISAKIMKECKEGDVYPCMGCRSFLTPDPVGHKYYGRFNQGVVTINLVDAACSSQKDMEAFWRIMDERLDLCYRALMLRHERLLGTPSDVAPILWQHGALARLQPGEKIDPLLYDNYSTISLGYAGLYECVRYMTGQSHTEPEGKKFGLKVMNYLNDWCAQKRAESNISFSLYGTPMESTTYKFAKCLQKRFGIIPEVSDHNYITNSYHINVREEIDAFDKLTQEAEFQRLSPGGCISYVEVPNMQNNIPAVLAVIRHIYDTIMYAELNTKSDYCQVCGYEGEIRIVDDENGKHIWECPNCGNRDHEKMNVARRVCGYISTNDFNQGRVEEIKERVLHL